ncbi:hypothetical protein POM88_047834 [Heracleum sosnowskyi]|uniref:Transposase n=1 Tax=Heracleum sosnowskyi TaxID=360622 RepID=A0AAD8GU71_9APIA|nr:hypothetical protein POM88_047834 [Heracleum sosnowskyi]
MPTVLLVRMPMGLVGGGETSGVGGRGCGASGGREAGGSSRRDAVLREGMHIFPLGVDADPRLHRGRGYSPGGFGLYPSKPIVIRIVGDEVVSPTAKWNILAIMCMFWPPGCVTAREIDIKSLGFWKKCLDEFLRYYTWDPKISNEVEAKASVITHMHKNFRHLPSDDKDRVIEIVKTNGGTYADHRPSHINPDVWDTLCKYWDSEIFRKRSAAGKAARKKVEVPHTSGATSFETRRRDYRGKNGGNLDYTIVYKDCHTLKDEKRKGKWISKKAKRIMGKAPMDEDDDGMEGGMDDGGEDMDDEE